MTKITVEAIVKSDLKNVWKNWTEPEHITQWNFASPEWQCPRASNDLRVGGKYAARMEAKDGSFGFDFEATYEEILPEKKITYTMGDGRKATTTFEKVSDGTKVVTVFDAETQNPVDMQRNGWQAILNNFKAHAEGSFHGH